jgi:hypothetical protein
MRGRSVAMIVAARHRMQEIFVVSLLIVAERQSGRFLVCRACGRSAWAARSFQCAPPSIALDVHLENRGVVNKAIDCRKSHGLIAEDSVMPQYLTGESLRSGWSTRTTRCMAAASRSLIVRQAADLG